MRLAQRFYSLTFLLLIGCAFNAQADNNTPLKEWVQDTLSKTLAVNYQQTSHDFAAIRNHYSYDAWNGMVNFLGPYMNVVRTKRLTLHPTFKQEPQIVASGIYSGIHFWRINQVAFFSQFNATIYFSLIVILTNTNNGGTYVIQSVSIQKQAFSECY